MHRPVVRASIGVIFQNPVGVRSKATIGEKHRLDALAQLIIRLTESKSPIEFVEWSFPDVELRIPDVKKAEALLGFRAHVELEEGLMRTIEWYRRKLNGEA